jgi:hypothetical protein
LVALLVSLTIEPVNLLLWVVCEACVVEELLSGVVTFLFTDVEGSTGLWERDEVGMDLVLARRDSIMRAEIAACAGRVFSTAGDSFAAAFAIPQDAVAAAVGAQEALAAVGLPFELMRLLGSRRSRDQILAEPWEGEPLVSALNHMPLPERDIVE